nr:unnamed protein product [Digitaria exilis]
MRRRRSVRPPLPRHPSLRRLQGSSPAASSSSAPLPLPPPPPPPFPASSATRSGHHRYHGTPRSRLPPRRGGTPPPSN